MSIIADGFSAFSGLSDIGKGKLLDSIDAGNDPVEILSHGENLKSARRTMATNDLEQHFNDLPISEPIDQAKIKSRNRDGLVLLLTGTVDRKKQLLAHANEAQIRLNSEIEEKVHTIQALKDEVRHLKLSAKGRDGKTFLLQYQVDKFRKQLACQTSSSPAVSAAASDLDIELHKQAWLQHWKRSRPVLDTLLQAGFAQVVTERQYAEIGTNTSIVAEPEVLAEGASSDESVVESGETPRPESRTLEGNSSVNTVATDSGANAGELESVPEMSSEGPAAEAELDCGVASEAWGSPLSACEQTGSTSSARLDSPPSSTLSGVPCTPLSGGRLSDGTPGSSSSRYCATAVSASAGTSSTLSLFTPALDRRALSPRSMQALFARLCTPDRHVVAAAPCELFRETSRCGDGGGEDRGWEQQLSLDCVGGGDLSCYPLDLLEDEHRQPEVSDEVEVTMEVAEGEQSTSASSPREGRHSLSSCYSTPRSTQLSSASPASADEETSATPSAQTPLPAHTCSVSRARTLDSRTLISCLSGSGGKTTRVHSDDAPRSHCAEVAGPVSPAAAPPSPPSKVLQFLLAEAARYAADATESAATQSNSASKPPPTSTFSDAHRPEPIARPMRRLTQSSAASAEVATVRTAPAESRPAAQALRDASAGGPSALLSPASFKDHLGRFRLENCRIRSDIVRFKGTVQRLRDEYNKENSGGSNSSDNGHNYINFSASTATKDLLISH